MEQEENKMENINQEFKFQGQSMPNLYDPRKDDISNSENWESSTNPAIWIANLLMAIPAKESIEWETVKIAADYCDETKVSIGGVVVGKLLETIRTLTKEFEGIVVHWEGKFHIFCEANMAEYEKIKKEESEIQALLRESNHAENKYKEIIGRFGYV